MLTARPTGREFHKVTLHGEIDRTLYFLKVGGATLAELSPAVREAEGLYKQLANDHVGSTMALLSMANRTAKEKSISVSQALKLISPQQNQRAIAPSEPEVTVLSPGETEAETSILAFVSTDNATAEMELKGLLGSNAEMKPETQAALLKWQSAVTAEVMRGRLARTVEVVQPTPKGGDRLYIPNGLFFELVEGDRLKFGPVAVTVLEVLNNGTELRVEPVARIIEGTGFQVNPESNQEIIGIPWDDNDQLLEAHYEAIFEFWANERSATPQGEPPLEHPAESSDVFDSPEEEMGNGESLQNSPQALPSTGTTSETQSEATATAAMN